MEHPLITSRDLIRYLWFWCDSKPRIATLLQSDTHENWTSMTAWLWQSQKCPYHLFGTIRGKAGSEKLTKPMRQRENQQGILRRTHTQRTMHQGQYMSSCAPHTCGTIDHFFMCAFHALFLWTWIRHHARGFFVFSRFSSRIGDFLGFF